MWELGIVLSTCLVTLLCSKKSLIIEFCCLYQENKVFRTLKVCSLRLPDQLGMVAHACRPSYLGG